MALRSKILTDQEKAAIVYITYGYIDDWREAYRIAAGMTREEAEKDIHLSVYTSKWKTSAKVQLYLQKVRDKKAVDENEKIREYEKEVGKSVRIETKHNDTYIDYTKPENQRRKLNELVNEAEDSGEALDALKVIISGQRDDKQAAKENQVQRFYVPQTCKDCPIKEAMAKLRREKVI